VSGAEVAVKASAKAVAEAAGTDVECCDFNSTVGS